MVSSLLGFFRLLGLLGFWRLRSLHGLREVFDVGVADMLHDRLDRALGGCLALVAFRSEHLLAVGRLEAETEFASLVFVDFKFVSHRSLRMLLKIRITRHRRWKGARC